MTSRRIATVIGVGGVVLLAFLMTATSAGLFHGAGPHATPDTGDRTVVAIDAHNGLYVNAMPTRPEDLVRRVRQTVADTQDKRVYVRADTNVRYGTVLDTMEELRAAGIDVNLVTRHP